MGVRTEQENAISSEELISSSDQDQHSITAEQDGCEKSVQKASTSQLPMDQKPPAVEDTETSQHPSDLKRQSSKQLSIIRLHEALSRFQELCPGSDVTEKCLKEALRWLHSFGLIIWHEGSESLEDMIFNDILTFIESLKSIFNHDVGHDLCFEKLDDILQEEFDDEQDNFEKAKKIFLNQGLMSLEILRCLLWPTRLRDHSEGVIDLLEKLELGHRLQTKLASYVFIPFYASVKRLPEKALPHLKTLNYCGPNALSVTCLLTGSLTITFWQKFCCCLVNDFFHGCEIQERDVFECGFWAMVNFVKVLVQYDGKDEISATLKTETDTLDDLWSAVESIYNASVTVKKLFPGSLVSCHIQCPQCGNNGSTRCVFFLKDSLVHDDALTAANCRDSGECFPIGLVKRIPKGEAGEERLRKLKDYLEKISIPTLNMRDIPIMPDTRDVSLLRLSENIGSNWKNLGRFLGLSNYKLQNISEDYKTDQLNATMEMLVSWRELYGRRPEALDFLSDKLRDIGLNPYVVPEDVDQLLVDVADRLGSSWRSVGVYLGLTWRELDQVTSPQVNQVETSRRMLQKWKLKCGFDMDRLNAALKQVGMPSPVECGTRS